MRLLAHRRLRGTAVACAALLVAGYTMTNPPGASANHPVFVEGEIDFDGDGIVGAAEDTDNTTDNVFGTLTAALAGANGGANQNGSVTIVTSGRFAEPLTITAANGNVTVEAADGVSAIIDAVVRGRDGNIARQGQVGITINATEGRVVMLRNLTIRNWTEGVRVMGSARVLMNNVRIDSSVGYGVRVMGSARVSLVDSTILGSGLRSAPGVDNTASPGVGVSFEGTSTGSISNSTVSGSVGAGLVNATSRGVRTIGLNAFDNGGGDQSGTFLSN